MKPLPVLLLALGAGLFGALLIDFLTLRPASDVPVEPPAPPSAPDEDDRPATVATTATPSIESLRAELDALREQVEELQRNQASAIRGPAGGAVSRVELDALRQELRSAVPPTEFETQVAETLKTIRKDEAVSKVKSNHQKNLARFEERMTELNEWLDLAPRQQTEMRSLIANKDTLDTELIAMWERGVDDEVLGEIKQTNEDEFNAAFMQILTPEQQELVYQAYGGKQENRPSDAK